MNKQSESGAVSLFVVIFAAMLLLIATVSFTRIMLADQRQATLNDVSQSAYDAAQAGVEDAKRVILVAQDCESGRIADASRCQQIANVINAKRCNTVQAALYGNTKLQEQMVRKNASDSAADAMDQAYTCVTINKAPMDYLGSLNKDQTAVVPISSSSPITSVEVRWYNAADRTNDADMTLGYPSYGSPANITLPRVWRASNPIYTNVPPMMRFQVASSDAALSGNQDQMRNAPGAAFLFPTTSNFSETTLSSRVTPSAPVLTKCSIQLAPGGYACSMKVNLPAPTSSTYVALTPLYGRTNFQLYAYNAAGQQISFGSAQIEVDSTGRANNLFRRILTRVEIGGDVSYPNAALSVDNNVCKDFIVTKNPSTFTQNCP